LDRSPIFKIKIIEAEIYILSKKKFLDLNIYQAAD